MLRRSLFISILVCVVAAGVAGADLLVPEVFKQSRRSESLPADFALSTFSNRGYEHMVELSMHYKTSGRFSYALIDTRDDSIVRAGEDTFEFEVEEGSIWGDGLYPSMEVNFSVDLPARDRSIRYKVSARYVPYNTYEWQTVTYTEYFTVRNINGRIVIE